MDYLTALKKSADRRLPEVILLDLNMPRKNGHEVLEEIKNDPALWQVPVVLLTVSERDEDVLEALKLKMNYYLAKPVTTDTLSAIIKAIHDLHTEARELDDPTDQETHIRLVLAGNPNTAQVALARLVDDPNQRVRCRVAENTRLTEEMQAKLVSDPQAEVRISLCENANLAGSVLELLANDESEDVRLAVSTSPCVTAEVLQLLAKDDNVFVSASATKSLAAIC
jgi:CheY-like chemotaxis protein